MPVFITSEAGAQIARELKAAIGRDVNIMDRSGIIIASTNPQRVGQTHLIAQRLIRQNLEVLEVSHTDWEDGVQEGVNLPIHVDGTCEGVIGITGPPAEVRIFGTIAKKMAEILLTSMNQQQQQALLERARNLFLEEWLFAPEVDWEAFAVRGNLLDIDIGLPRTAAILELENSRADPAFSSALAFRGSRFYKMIAPHLAADPQNLWAVMEHCIIILFSPRSAGKARLILQTILDEAKRCGVNGLYGGLSACARSGQEMRRCYAEAKIAAGVASLPCSILQYNNASMEFVLQSIDAEVKHDVLQTVFPPISPEEQLEVQETLHLYFQHDGNIDGAAGEAAIHPNTFRYRLLKIQRLTGYDYRKPRDCVMLYITLQFLGGRAPHPAG